MLNGDNAVNFGSLFPRSWPFQLYVNTITQCTEYGGVVGMGQNRIFGHKPVAVSFVGSNHDI